jgi:hypothetical protein
LPPAVLTLGREEEEAERDKIDVFFQTFLFLVRQDRDSTTTG